MPPDMQFLLGEMNAKIDTLLRRAEEDRTQTQQQLKAQDERISQLEAFRWKILGASAVLGAGFGWLTKVLSP